MRSRTELVTTTFIDSEDDFTETDDSEEDWRPSASNRNVKKRTAHTTKGRNRSSRKRKSSGTSSSGTAHKNPRRQAALDANYQTFDDSDEDDDDDFEYYRAKTQLAAEVEPKAIILPPKKKEKNANGGGGGGGGKGTFQLYLYRKDLKEDYVTNTHLCLWRKDGSNLLQKYIRVKTSAPEEFMFTSSSVYSTWDEKRRRDFVSITVRCLEENNRRVTFVNTSDIHSIARTELERLSPGFEQIDNELAHENYEENDENDNEHENGPDADGSDHNSGESECEYIDGSYHPDDDDLEVEPEDENIDELDEQISDENPDEEELEDYVQIEEEEDDDDDDEDDGEADEDDNIVENDDNEKENEADHN